MRLAETPPCARLSGDFFPGSLFKDSMSVAAWTQPLPCSQTIVAPDRKGFATVNMFEQKQSFAICGNAEGGAMTRQPVQQTVSEE